MSRSVFNVYPHMFGRASLTEWDIDGVRCWGEDQDVWHPGQVASLRPRLTPHERERIGRDAGHWTACGCSISRRSCPGRSAAVCWPTSGADVVKVEPPEGDIIRGVEPRGRPRAAQRLLHVGERGEALGSASTSAPSAAPSWSASWPNRVTWWSTIFRPGVLEKFGLDANADRVPPGAHLLLDQRVGLLQLVVPTTCVRRDGPGRVGRGPARRAAAQRAAGAESARRRRHHPRAARGERHPRRAVPTRTHWRGPAPRRLHGRSARLHRRMDVDGAGRLRRRPHPRHMELPDLRGRRRHQRGVHGRPVPAHHRDRCRAD